MSTNSIVVGIVFCGLKRCRRAPPSLGSGTGTMPTFGSMVQKG